MGAFTDINQQPIRYCFLRLAHPFNAVQFVLGATDCLSAKALSVNSDAASAVTLVEFVPETCC
jgi:hypothetical protein